MANGFPHPELFPLARVTAEAKDGTTVVLEGDVLAAAQQYAPSAGYEPLRAWTEAWTARHCRPRGPVRATMTCGNFDGLARTLDVLLQPGRDALLVDQHTFPHSMGILAPWAEARDVALVEVGLDEDGLDPAALRGAVAAARADGRVPRVLLTVPTGQNPTTVDMTPKALQNAYELARQHDMWIVEDDPYYYTHFRSPVPGEPEPEPRPSYLAFDGDGRVVRLDSFSKWFAPGARLGWITAHPTVVAAIAPLLAFPSTLSQVIVHRLLDAWGDAGLAAHLRRLHARYAAKCELLDAALRDAGVGAVASWDRPRSGMFFWLRVTGGAWASRLAEAGGGAALARAAADNHLVTVVPGSLFRTGGAPSDGLRLTFVAVPDAEIAEGARRLAALLGA